MAEITAGMVKDLREKTGVGMMDCKAALAATNGDNTNIVIAQIAQRRYEVDTVIARIESRFSVILPKSIAARNAW